MTARHVLFETAPDEGLTSRATTTSCSRAGASSAGRSSSALRANARVGSGHIYHCLQLADELADQQLCFLLVDCDPFVARR